VTIPEHERVGTLGDRLELAAGRHPDVGRRRVPAVHRDRHGGARSASPVPPTPTSATPTRSPGSSRTAARSTRNRGATTGELHARWITWAIEDGADPAQRQAVRQGRWTATASPSTAGQDVTDAIVTASRWHRAQTNWRPCRVTDVTHRYLPFFIPALSRNFALVFTSVTGYANPRSEGVRRDRPQHPRSSSTGRKVGTLTTGDCGPVTSVRTSHPWSTTSPQPSHKNVRRTGPRPPTARRPNRNP
jgi:hypothetical protein